MKKKNSTKGKAKKLTINPSLTIRKLAICGKIACYLILGVVIILVILSAFFIFGV